MLRRPLLALSPTSELPTRRAFLSNLARVRKIFTAWAVVYGAAIVAFLIYGQVAPGFGWKQYLWLLPIGLRFALCAYGRSENPRVSCKTLA